jgi:uncharacterized membrane protein YccF (DUF307 family)
VLFPFGRTQIEVEDAFVQSIGNECFHFFWIFSGCLPLVILHFIVALISGISIVGIPICLKHWNFAIHSFWPFDKQIVVYQGKDE